jgi:hypothetical protein
VPKGQSRIKLPPNAWSDRLAGGFTVTVVVAGAEVQAPTVTVALYVPELVVLAPAIEGFWFVDANPFGPVQL